MSRLVVDSSVVIKRPGQALGHDVVQELEALGLRFL
jgi:hypothetical protein